MTAHHRARAIFDALAKRGFVINPLNGPEIIEIIEDGVRRDRADSSSSKPDVARSMGNNQSPH